MNEILICGKCGLGEWVNSTLRRPCPVGLSHIALAVVLASFLFLLLSLACLLLPWGKVTKSIGKCSCGPPRQRGADAEARPWCPCRSQNPLFVPRWLSGSWVGPSTLKAGRQGSLGLAVPRLASLALGHCPLVTRYALLHPRLPPAVPHPHRSRRQLAPPHSLVLPTLHFRTGCEGEHTPTPPPPPRYCTLGSRVPPGLWRHSVLSVLEARFQNLSKPQVSPTI